MIVVEEWREGVLQAWTFRCRERLLTECCARLRLLLQCAFYVFLPFYIGEIQVETVLLGVELFAGVNMD